MGVEGHLSEFAKGDFKVGLALHPKDSSLLSGLAFLLLDAVGLLAKEANIWGRTEEGLEGGLDELCFVS